MEKQERVFRHHYGGPEDVPSWKKEEKEKRRAGVGAQYRGMGTSSVDPGASRVTNFNESQNSSPVSHSNETGKVFAETWKDQPQVVEVKRTTRTVEHYDENGKYTGSTKEVTEEEEFLREYYIT